jgi:aminoglycoside phosphotransferase (APT) family kinase protein
MRDGETRAAIESLRDTLDTRAAIRAWEAALGAPAWTGPPVWIHGDLHSGNVLARQGRLSAVIDFGCLGVGDPACDVMVAWTLFTAESRNAFRAALLIDDTTWARGRGWALSVALIALPYYRGTNADIVARAERTISEVLADQATNA